MDRQHPGDPLPRPNLERLNLPDEDHLAFWQLVIREFPWVESRRQALLLYRNVLTAPYEGEVGS